MRRLSSLFYRHYHLIFPFAARMSSGIDRLHFFGGQPAHFDVFSVDGIRRQHGESLVSLARVPGAGCYRVRYIARAFVLSATVCSERQPGRKAVSK